ncbi:unnamed protein product [Ranitomeya imitator]|uniref:Solute carrier family 35 member B1 n=1 Tax=Ranitomeya imitator TaxID=111125 RepID=A0ABN9LIM2_9NEOB|nr:unnamed protein product [Ranitomeya imitator]
MRCTERSRVCTRCTEQSSVCMRCTERSRVYKVYGAEPRLYDVYEAQPRMYKVYGAEQHVKGVRSGVVCTRCTERSSVCMRCTERSRVYEVYGAEQRVRSGAACERCTEWSRVYEVYGAEQRVYEVYGAESCVQGVRSTAACVRGVRSAAACVQGVRSGAACERCTEWSRVYEVYGAQPRVYEVYGAQPRVYEVYGAQPRVYEVYGAQPHVYKVYGAESCVRGVWSHVYEVYGAQPRVYEVYGAEPCVRGVRSPAACVRGVRSTAACCSGQPQSGPSVVWARCGCMRSPAAERDVRLEVPVTAGGDMDGGGVLGHGGLRLLACFLGVFCLLLLLRNPAGDNILYGVKVRRVFWPIKHSDTVVCKPGIGTFGSVDSTRGTYGEGENKEKFRYALSLVFVQCVVNALFAKLLIQFFDAKAKPDRTQSWLYAACSLSYVGAMVSSNSALQYVNYPTQVLGKSCKPIPVMLLGVTLLRKKYPLTKYLCVLLIVVGVALFMYKPKNSGATGDDHVFGYGEMLLLLSLTLDGLTGVSQDHMRAHYQTGSNPMMFHINLWSSLFLGAGCSQSAVSRHLNGKSVGRKQCGRKRCTTRRGDRTLRKIVEKDRFQTLGNLRKQWTESGVETSRATVHRRVQEMGYRCRIPQGRVNAASYQEILEHFMLPSAEMLYGDEDFIFQHDLAPAHSAKTTGIIFTGEVWEFVSFTERYPSIIYNILLFSLTSALGQTFIFMTVVYFGPLTCSIITTTRKFFTILASVILFSNPISGLQWVGTMLVFLGLGLDAKFGKGSKKPSH